MVTVVSHLNKKALAALRQYESDWGRTSEYISITSKGKQIDSSSLDETLRRMATEAGITKKVHLHMLRHTFASRALSPEIGVDVGTVSKWLGHSSITITYNVYVHVLESTETTPLPCWKLCKRYNGFLNLCQSLCQEI